MEIFQSVLKITSLQNWKLTKSLCASNDKIEVIEVMDSHRQQPHLKRWLSAQDFAVNNPERRNWKRMMPPSLFSSTFKGRGASILWLDIKGKIYWQFHIDFLWSAESWSDLHIEKVHCNGRHLQVWYRNMFVIIFI